MNRASFLAEYGGIFEHSPWIARAVWENDSHSGSVQELHSAFSDVIRSASRGQQLALLRAHPQLASAIASGEELTPESRGEQHGAGLNQCSTQEFEEFERLNRAYTNKFGFPFIMAVKPFSRGQILETFRRRLASGQEQEFREALDQVILIGKFRLQDLAAVQESTS